MKEGQDNLERAERLAAKVKEVLTKHPEADPDNVRHTLILLEMPPEERLARSLLRGGARAGTEREISLQCSHTSKQDLKEDQEDGGAISEMIPWGPIRP